MERQMEQKKDGVTEEETSGKGIGEEEEEKDTHLCLTKCSFFFFLII